MGRDEGSDDPKGLIRDAYRIDGITLPECRSIFLDWALSVSGRPADAIERLLVIHGRDGHPMTQVLREGQAVPPTPKRRGGRAARVAD